MSRWADSLNQAAAELDAIRGCWAVDLAFDSGHVRANDSASDITFGGNTYTGIGTFGTFDTIEESVEVVAKGLRFELGGVDSGLISTIMTEQYQGRAASLYVAMLAEQDELVATPELRWSGYMDTMTIEKSAKEVKIIVQCEHRLRNAPPFSRFSDADQKARSASDYFFDRLHFVAGYTSFWGGRSTGWNYRPGGGYYPT